jgi:transcriptional regulator GlxA family with amidase domain
MVLYLFQTVIFMNTEVTHLSFILIPRFNMLTLTGSIEPARIANYLSPTRLYDWDYRTVETGAVQASNGMEINCKDIDSVEGSAPDIIFICGSWGAEHYDNKRLINWLRRQERKGTKLVAVEMGVYAIARAGLLSGKKVTTHWSWKPGLEEEFPGIEVCEQLYTMDGKISSVSGGTACIDLMITMIAGQHGEQLASEVSNQMLHYPRRPATAAQRVAASGNSEEVHPQVREAMTLIEANIEEPLPVPELCRLLETSQRQLERLFKRDTGCSIVQFSQLVRLQYARVLLTSTRMSIREVSVACGFNSLSYFSLSFMKCFSKKPSQYRQAWPVSEPAPSWPGTLYSFVQKSREAQEKLRE